MIQQAVDAWGRVDVLVNNAGILRDKSFAKMEMSDFDLVVDVHLLGAVLHQSSLALHGGAGLRSHRYDVVLQWTFRQLWSGQLLLPKWLWWG